MSTDDMSIDEMSTEEMNTHEPVTIAVVSAGVSDPSSTRMLADRVAQRALDALAAAGTPARAAVIDLAPFATDIVQTLVAGFPTPAVKDAVERLAAADALVVGTPVYKAGISGLFKAFADVLDDDLLIAKPVVLTATGGSARHAMVVDEHLRPLFAFMRAITVPTSVYAAPEDWAAPDLGQRIGRAATELALLLRSGAPQDIADGNWHGHQHAFGGNATRAKHSAADVDFDSDLMRIAAGGH